MSTHGCTGIPCTICGRDPLTQWSGVLKGLAESERQDAMIEHVMIVSDVATRPLEFDRWQATCSCGFIGNIGPEGLADEQANEHRHVAEIAAAVAAEREAIARLIDADLHGNDRLAAAIRARGGES